MNKENPALRDWLALLRVPGVGPTHGGRLLRHFGCPAAALAASPGEWQAAGVPPELREGYEPGAWTRAVDRDLAWLHASGAHELITLDDARYPDRLREIRDPPLALFCRGDASLLSRPQLAIVGARHATPQGLESASDFAAELTRGGLLVASGMARGIDGAAHHGALDAGGATLAVCGTGLDTVYPSRHRKLAQRIAEQGVLVSEFPTGTAPVPENFPRRNRILSGLSLGVLVVEAALDSGSLITARRAMDQGREVFALPGSVHSPLSRGPHALIRQGAKLTENVADIFDEVGVLAREGMKSIEEPDVAASRDPEQQRVLEAIGQAATPVDKLVERLGMPVQALSATLLALELHGLVAIAPGGAYQRVGQGARH